MITKKTVVTYTCDICGLDTDAPAGDYNWQPNTISIDQPTVNIHASLRVPYMQHGDEPCICRKCFRKALLEIAACLDPNKK